MLDQVVFKTTIRNDGSDVVKLTHAEAYTPFKMHSTNLTDCTIGLSPRASITTKTEVSFNMADVAGYGFGFEVYASALGQHFSRCAHSASLWQDVPYIETPAPTTAAPSGLPTCYHIPSPTAAAAEGAAESKPPVPSYTRSPVHIPTPPPHWAPSTAPAPQDFDIRDIVERVALQGGREFYGDTYQARAIEWLEVDEYSYGLSEERINQRYALACIYFATYAVRTIYTVMEPRGWIDSSGWVSEGSECEWFGISCDEKSRVVGIMLVCVLFVFQKSKITNDSSLTLTPTLFRLSGFQSPIRQFSCRDFNTC